jgi:hypothetical protein
VKHYGLIAKPLTNL